MSENACNCRIRSTQNTGNPVLDSLVNLYADHIFSPAGLRDTHAVLLELAEKEPGGLKRVGVIFQATQERRQAPDR